MGVNQKIIHGDCIEVMRGMDAGSVQCVVTSPPYWGLRDYQVDGQIGLEPTLEAYVEKMVEVFRGVWRVLRDDGTLWLNMGDSYTSGNRNTYGPVNEERGDRNVVIADMTRPTTPDGLKPKDLCGVPWRLAFALQADGWYLRSDIIWHKPNPMPESCTDRPTKAHEYLFLMTKRPTYYYDAEAIREVSIHAGKVVTLGDKSLSRGQAAGAGVTPSGNANADFVVVTPNRNKRSVWNIPTEAFSDAHFAVFPRRLVEPCVMAGTSDKGCCPECGAPWARVVEKDRRPTRPGERTKVCGTNSRVFQDRDPEHPSDRKLRVGNRDPQRNVTETRTVGWKPGCECYEIYATSGLTRNRPGDTSEYMVEQCKVLDPFAGSGTVGVVCRQLGRTFVGIELSLEYCEMARKRIANPERLPPLVDVPDQMKMGFAE